MIRNKESINIKSKSVSVDYSTSMFEYMIKGGFNELEAKHPNIVGFIPERQVTDNSGDIFVEFIGEVVIGNVIDDNEYKLKIKTYTTTASVELQSMGNPEDLKLFADKMKISTVEFLANILIDFAKEIKESSLINYSLPKKSFHPFQPLFLNEDAGLE